MATYRSSRVFPIILVVIIIIIAITALVSLARVVFFSGSSPSNATVDVSRDALLATDADRRVEMTVRGPIVADERFSSYRVSISPSIRTITTYQSYLDRVVDRVELGNNVVAYEQFVFALDKANLSDGEEFGDERDDIRGVCATGEVTQFAILDGEKSVKTLWTSTCGGSPGTLDGNVTQLKGLFIRQIPDANRVIQAVNL